MKPVAVFRHAQSEGPGHFATYLASRSIPFRLVALDAGESVPRDPAAFSGLVFMGGPMSVNDEGLPWLAPAVELVRAAVRRDVPLLGHCLGGQLISKALGGTVSQAPVREIGWGTVNVEPNEVAGTWFGELASFEAFHWHAETFTIPYGATRVLSSPYCKNQAYALGKHFGMQCHVEVTVDLVRSWYALGADEINASLASPGVQDEARALHELQLRVTALNRVAERIYARWCEGLARD